MKKLFVLLAILICTTAFVVQTTTNKAAATADQEQGMYIFIKSKPVTETVYLGKVTVGLRVTGDPLSTLIKLAKKEYPDAEALIINETDLQKAKADVVKFK